MPEMRTKKALDLNLLKIVKNWVGQKCYKTALSCGSMCNKKFHKSEGDTMHTGDPVVSLMNLNLA